MNVNGIEIKIRRKRIKNIHLYVKPPRGDVEVSCPQSFSDENIRFFVCSNFAWVTKKRDEYLNHPRQTKREYVTGETLYLWGKGYYLLLKTSAKEYSIKISGNTLILTVRKGCSLEQKTNAVESWYRGLLRQEIDRQLPKIEKATGLSCASFRIQKMETRWGSCNHDDKTLLFNLFLAQKPKTCLNYVIVHELAHTVERTHNKAFVAILDKYLPNWRERKKLLNSTISIPWEE